MADRSGKTLGAQANRFIGGYLIAVAVAVIILVVSYLSLSKTLQQQQNLTQLHSLTSSVQLTLRNTYHTTVELEDAFRSNSTVKRQLHQIQESLSNDIDRLKQLRHRLNLTVDELMVLDTSAELYALYSDIPYQLNTRLERYITWLQELLRDNIRTAGAQNSTSLTTDARGAAQGPLIDGYRQAMDKTQFQLESLTKKLQLQYTTLSLVFVIALIAVTVLIFLPLLKGLKQVHQQVVRAQHDLEFRAFHDPVTLLPNSAGTTRLLSHENQYELLVLIKVANLSHTINLIGPMNQDKYIHEFAQRLETLFPDECLIARTGDSEFAVLFTATDSDLLSGSQMGNELRKPVVVNKARIYPFLVLGSAALSDSGSTFENHLSNARLAARRFHIPYTQVPLYTDCMLSELIEENHIAEKIRTGLPRNEFEPFYQIKVDAKTASPAGLEALCRWHDPVEGLVSPGRFIPVAESRGLIVDLTWAMFNRVARDYINWWQQGIQPDHVAVNVAQAVLQDPEFGAKLQTIRTMFTAAGLPTDLQPIEIEITENVALSNSSGEIKVALDHIRRANIEIAFDDFGTGYASLRSIVDLDLDIIKIDQSFIANLTTDARNRSIVESILSICHALHKTSVAEGVETVEQVEMLQNMGCDILQGFYFYKPCPFDEVTAELRRCADIRLTG